MGGIPRIRTMSSGSSGQRLTNPVMSLSIDFLTNLISAEFGDWLELWRFGGSR